MRSTTGIAPVLRPFLLLAILLAVLGGAAPAAAAEPDAGETIVAARQAFDDQLYRRCLDHIEALRRSGAELPESVELLEDRARLRSAVTRDDATALEEAVNALVDRLGSGELDEEKARVAADLVDLPRAIASGHRVGRLLDEVRRYYEEHPEPRRVLDDYVALFEAGLRSAGRLRQPVPLDLEAMWSNLVRFPLEEAELLRLGARALLGVAYRDEPAPERYAPMTWPDLVSTGRPGRLLLQGPTDFADRVARDLLRLEPAPWLVADAHLVAGLHAERQDRFGDAVEHFEAARRVAAEDEELALAHDTAVENLRRIRAPQAEVEGPDRYRPGSAQLLRLRWRNAERWELTVERLDPRADLRVPEGVVDRVPGSWRELDTFFAPDAGEVVLRRSKADEAERSARRGRGQPHRMRSDRLWIDPLDPGLYRVRLRTEGFGDAPGAESRMVLAVTDLGLQAQVEGDALEGRPSLEGWVVDVRTGRAAAGVDLDLLSIVRRDEPGRGRRPHFEIDRHELRSDDDGRLRLELDERGSVAEHVVVGEKDGRPVVGFLRGLHFGRGLRDTPRLSGLVWSDRPLYRPGETIHVQAFARWMDDARREIRVPAGESFTLSLLDPQGQPLFERTVVLDDNGSAEESFVLSDRPDLGRYSMQLQAPDGRAALRETLRVEEVRLPEFEVSVRVDAAERAVLGDTLRVEVEAEYLFGGPVAGEAEITLHRRPRWRIWPPAPLERPMATARLQPDARIWPYPGPEQEIRRETLTLDARGRAVLTHLTEADGETRDWEYVARARVTDASRRSEEGEASRALGRTALIAHLHTAQAVVAPGDLARFVLRVEDVDGEGLSHRGAWQMSRLTDEGPRVLRSDSVSTDAEGRAELTFRPEREGSYRLEYRTDDGRGHEVVASTDLWCADPSTRDVVHRGDGLQLIAESEEVVGDTARVLLVSDVTGVDVWLTRAFAGATTSRVVSLSGTVRLLEIPIDRRHRPSFQLRAIGAHDYRWRQAELRVEVPDRDRMLDVRVDFEEESSRPGRIAPLRIRALDLQGEPVQTVLSLSVVDRAVLTLVERPDFHLPEVFHRFTEPRLPPARSADARQSAYVDLDPEQEEIDRALGERGVQEENVRSLGKGAMAGAASPETARMAADVAPQTPAALSGSVEVRSDFRPTALWRTGIRTDADGRARIDVPLPSSLTTWEALALAVDPQTRVGRGEASVQTRLPIMVRLQHPRVLREGDEVRLVAIVHNETAEDVEAFVQIDPGLLHTDDGSHRVLVEAGGETRVEWTARVPAESARLEFRRDEAGRVLGVEPGATRLEVTARTRLGDDAMAREVPLHPMGTPLRRVSRAVLDPDPDVGTVDDPRPTAQARLSLDLPTRRAENAELARLHVAPSVLAGCIQSLPWLADYPYGCTEQTLSRFVPAVAVRAVVEAMGLPAERIDPDLDAKVSEGLERIVELQRPSGAWGWWKNGPENAYMTAYAVRSLAVALEHGVGGTRAVLGRGREALGRMVLSIERPDDQAYALAALAAADAQLRGDGAWEASEAEGRLLDALFDDRDRLRPYARALLAKAEHLRGRDDRARDHLRHLENNLERGPEGTAHWGSTRPRWRGDGAVEATAFALEAYLAVDPDRALRDAAVRWLMLNREGRRWTSTRSTAHAVIALTRHAAREGQGRVLASELVVRHEGREVARLEIGLDALLEDRLHVDLPAGLLGDGENRLDLELVGAGPVFVALEVSSFTQQEEIAAGGDRLHVEREVVALRPVHTIGGTVIAVEDSLAEPRVESGRRLRVRLRLRADHDIDFVVLEDPRPAGAEPVERLSGWHHGADLSARREVRREQNTFFVEHLPAGEHVLEYEIRAESPGDYRIEPARVSGMYLPTWAGHSADGRLAIDERPDAP